MDNECLLLSAPKIHSACLLLVPRIENDLFPRESAMISAVLKNVLKVEGGKMFSDFWREMSSERTLGIGCLEEM